MSAPATNPAVSVLIPSAVAGTRLVGLVAMLLGHRSAPVEVLVADNGLDRTVRVALRGVGARVVDMGGNAGFATAVNRVAEVAEGSVLVVTNDDIEPGEGFATALASPVADGFGMAAGVLVKPEAPDLIESAGLVIDPVLGWHDHLHDQQLEVLDDGPPPPLGPSGAAAAYDRNAFIAIGGFDEGFFAYGEDVDMALRLRREGLRCALATKAVALHNTSRTLGYDSLAKALLVGRSRGHLMRKYGVLRRPLRGIQALTIELTASVMLATRHRSLAPGRARLAGWRECRRREKFPPRDWLTMGLLEGLRQRRAWYQRVPQTAAPRPADRL